LKARVTVDRTGATAVGDQQRQAGWPLFRTVEALYTTKRTSKKKEEEKENY
jgi:hypothetical protein